MHNTENTKRDFFIFLDWDSGQQGKIILNFLQTVWEAQRRVPGKQCTTREQIQLSGMAHMSPMRKVLSCPRARREIGQEALAHMSPKRKKSLVAQGRAGR